MNDVRETVKRKAERMLTGPRHAEYFQQDADDVAEAYLALESLCGELLGVCNKALMMRNLGGMLPGVKQIMDMVVEAAEEAIAKAHAAGITLTNQGAEGTCATSLPALRSGRSTER